MSRAAIIVATIILATPAYAQTAYFATIPDLPVASGLSESPSQIASFAAGQDSGIVIAAAHGSASPAQVRSFYMESLSPLGWAYEPTQADENLTFLRGRERLVIHVEPQGGGTHLGVRLIVSPASMNAD